MSMPKKNNLRSTFARNFLQNSRPRLHSVLMAMSNKNPLAFRLGENHMGRQGKHIAVPRNLKGFLVLMKILRLVKLAFSVTKEKKKLRVIISFKNFFNNVKTTMCVGNNNYSQK